ncbi:aspartate ammonia-lyase [Sporolactobacillus shoreae]|uniref:Aspartate ammonia-lyase n=1 Tax=Sporolactobacillus shoreae TaxID=1465501 RepID=A0A4Z0GPQ3_9BACL|nr:aspartate ammonia-lyase [Sporolactobacillus shoreae]TGA99197.1 aspartate ammonia-lyase [Sporolactobacillus shoreae]
MAIILIRKEHDLLGQKEVPADAYYGIQTLRAAENFPITGYRIHPELIRATAMVKKAAALANVDAKQLNPAIGRAVAEAADEILNGQWHDQFIVDPIQGGAGTSINMNANEVLANRALELTGKQKGDYASISPNNHVNKSQSTNDVFPTATRLASIRLLQKLIQTIRSMVRVFQEKAKTFDPIVKIGRTHLQDAVPIRLGQEFAAYGHVLERDIRRIARAEKQLHTISIGATAVGTGLNASPEYRKYILEYLSGISGLKLERAEDLVDATQNTDAYTEVSAALKICMINMSKIANDLRLMASGPRAGLGEINLPALQPGSSIMPGKVNPVMAEVVNQVAFQVIGNDHTISMASEAGQFELNVMEPVLVFNLLQSIDLMIHTFSVFTGHCLEGITANNGTLKRYADQSTGVVTALSPYIGYEEAGRIAREALATGKTVRELCLAHCLLSEEKLNHILDPHEMTEIRSESDDKEAL